MSAVGYFTYFISRNTYNIPKTLAIKVKPSAEKHILQGHPWVFDESIVKQSAEAEPGALAILFRQKNNKFLALGLYDSDSPIRIKILSTQNGVKIDQGWFDEKVAVAFAKRKTLLETDTNAYRLLFGENDGLPSLICDIYDQVGVLKVYSRIWLPYLEMITAAILKTIELNALVLRHSRSVSKYVEGTALEEGSLLHGRLTVPEIIFKEHGVLFSAHVIKGHKTGFFLDHRHNRLAIQGLAQDKTVLDVFSYAGGFSVHALCGGAKVVTSLDLSGPALELAKKNAALNKVKGRHITLKGDAFRILNDLMQQRKKYDLVIIDPPSFAKAAKEIPKALEQYERLALLGAQLVNRQGILVLASCSSRIKSEEFFELTSKALRNSGRRFTEMNRTLHDVDHPIGFEEGQYLKTIYYREGEGEL